MSDIDLSQYTKTRQAQEAAAVTHDVTTSDRDSAYPAEIVVEVRKIEARSAKFQLTGGLVSLMGLVIFAVASYWLWDGATPDLPIVITTLDVPGSLQTSLSQVATASPSYGGGLHSMPFESIGESMAGLIKAIRPLAIIGLGMSLIAFFVGTGRQLASLTLGLSLSLMTISFMSSLFLPDAPKSPMEGIRTYISDKDWTAAINALQDKTGNPLEISYLRAQGVLLNSGQILVKKLPAELAKAKTKHLNEHEEKIVAPDVLLNFKDAQVLMRSMIADEKFLQLSASPREIYALEIQLLGKPESIVAKHYAESAAQEAQRISEKWTGIKLWGIIGLFFGIGFTAVGGLFRRRVTRIRDMSSGMVVESK